MFRSGYFIPLLIAIFCVSFLVISCLVLVIEDDGEEYEITCRLGIFLAYVRMVKRQPLEVKDSISIAAAGISSQPVVVRRVMKKDGSYFFSDVERYVFGSNRLFEEMNRLYSMDPIRRLCGRLPERA